MAEGGEDTGGEEEVVGGCEGAGEVAEGEDAHEEEQGELAFEPGGGDRHDGRADGDAEGVAGDEEACAGDADVKALGEIGEQAHDDELRGADAEGGDGERHEGLAGEDAA